MNGKKRYLIPIMLLCLMAGQIGLTYADDIIPHLDVSVTNTTIAAGTHGIIGITINNSGSYDATEVEAFLTSATPGIAILSGAQKVVNTIDKGTSTTYNATVMVDQSVAVGDYPITMTLSYLRAGRGIVTVTIPITIVVNRMFLPMVEVTVSPNELNVSAINDVTMKVRNIADTKINNVAIALSTASPFLSIESTSNYNITTLNSNDSMSFRCQSLCTREYAHWRLCSHRLYLIL